MIAPLLIQKTICDVSDKRYFDIRMELASTINGIPLKKVVFNIFCEFDKINDLESTRYDNTLSVDLCTCLITDTETNKTPKYIFPLVVPEDNLDVATIDLDVVKQNIKKVTNNDMWILVIDRLIELNSIEAILL